MSNYFIGITKKRFSELSANVDNSIEEFEKKNKGNSETLIGEAFEYVLAHSIAKTDRERYITGMIAFKFIDDHHNRQRIIELAEYLGVDIEDDLEGGIHADEMPGQKRHRNQSN